MMIMKKARSPIYVTPQMENIILDGWQAGDHRDAIVKSVWVVTGLKITHGQVMAAVDRARQRNDARAVSRKKYATYVRSS